MHSVSNWIVNSRSFLTSLFLCIILHLILKVLNNCVKAVRMKFYEGQFLQLLVVRTVWEIIAFFKTPWTRRFFGGVSFCNGFRTKFFFALLVACIRVLNANIAEDVWSWAHIGQELKILFEFWCSSIIKAAFTNFATQNSKSLHLYFAFIISVACNKQKWHKAFLWNFSRTESTDTLLKKPVCSMLFENAIWTFPGLEESSKKPLFFIYSFILKCYTLDPTSRFNSDVTPSEGSRKFTRPDENTSFDVCLSWKVVGVTRVKIPFFETKNVTCESTTLESTFEVALKLTSTNKGTTPSVLLSHCSTSF